MEATREQIIEAVGQAVGRRLQSFGPYGARAVVFVPHPADPDVLGIRGLGRMPLDWWKEVSVEGYAVEVIGKSVRIS